MDNFRGMTVSHQGTNTNANNPNPNAKNRNRKKKNKQQNPNQINQQNNQNMPLSPSKTLINPYSDYAGSMSLGTFFTSFLKARANFCLLS